MTAPKTNLLPPPSDEEYEALKASIREHGYWSANPVVVDEAGDILDGHTRARACHELGVIYPTITLEGLSAWQKVDYCVRANVTRRQLSPAQRRELLKRLKELYDAELRRDGLEAKAAGGRKSVSLATNLAPATSEDAARDAAADAAQTRFDEPVVAIPAAKDRLSTLGRMVGVSRATVARDEQALDRLEKIEAAATEQGRDDVVRMIDRPRPNLDELERAVGLRDALPVVEKLSVDRVGWVVNLAQALNNLAPSLSEDEADLLWSKVGNPALVLVQLGQLRSAVAEAKARGRKG